MVNGNDMIEFEEQSFFRINDKSDFNDYHAGLREKRTEEKWQQDIK